MFLWRMIVSLVAKQTVDTDRTQPDAAAKQQHRERVVTEVTLPLALASGVPLASKKMFTYYGRRNGIDCCQFGHDTSSNESKSNHRFHLLVHMRIDLRCN